MEASQTLHAQDAPDSPPLRIKISNIPKTMSVSRLKSFCTEVLKVPAEQVTVRKSGKWSFGFVSIRAAGMAMSEVLGCLNQARWQGERIAAVADNSPESIDSIPRKIKPTPVDRLLNDQVTSLWRLSYPEQLSYKQTLIDTILGKVKADLEKSVGSEHIRSGILAKSKFTVENVIASPVLYGYRNKAEFTVGVDRDGIPCVGLCLGGFRDGFMSVDSPVECLHLPGVFKAVAAAAQEAILASQRSPFNVVSKHGFWRIVLVRVHGGRVMVGLQVNRDKALNDDQIALEVKLFEERMQQFEYTDDATNSTFKIDSFSVQITDAGHSGLDMKKGFECRFGEPELSETIQGLKFRISPLSFFQNNPPATELLYDQIRQFTLDGDSASKPLLLDVCCGTGTIGLSMAGSVDKVVGVEMVEDAVLDARRNATDNGIENVEFVCGKAENVMDSVISQVKSASQPVSVVLDPPRAGVHPSVIAAVRGCDRIDRVVLVACDAKQAANNIVDLMRPSQKRLTGLPFYLKRIVAVDLFPHTPHVELVMQFQRARDLSE